LPPSCDHQMECNKEEAVRAREIAERKFAIHDFVGAKKFLIKAQSLFPDLDGVSQMLAVVDVHSVAAVKVGSNETDWYGILQVICSSQLFFSFPCFVFPSWHVIFNSNIGLACGPRPP
jgi:hypothetical protein